MAKKGVWYGMGICFLFLYILQPAKKARAVAQVYTGQQFRQVMGRSGKERVELCTDLNIESPVVVRGDKEIYGGGHRLVRSRKGGRIYGGSLFLIQGGNCTWRDVTISGGGRGRELSGKVFGRLIEIRQGTLTIGKGCILRDNINDALAVDGGGALLVGADAVCKMEGGLICGNKNVSKGAGVVVEKEGKFIMTGGDIKDNIVTASGKIEGFDGRGGAIYNEGLVVIRGGTIKGNTAHSYKRETVQYGGVGAALYAAADSIVQIEGGVILNNRDEGGGPIWILGQISLGGEPTLQNIYLGKKKVIRAKQSFRPKDSLVVQPEVYAAGICIAKGREAPFKLKPRKGYELERKKKGYYICKKLAAGHEKLPAKRKASPKKKETDSAGVKGKTVRRKVKKRKMPSKKRAAPVIYGRKTAFVLYEGENVKPEIFLSGVRAVDPKEGDITDKIRVVSPRHIATDEIRRGTILYEVENQEGIRTRKKGRYRIEKNHLPTIRTVPRFLFLWEVAGYTRQQWRELLLEECKVTDDCDGSLDLRETTVVEYRKFEEIGAGSHELTVTVRDQYGHRFYMKPGEKKRYGEGKEITVKIPVTLVDAAEIKQEEKTGVRFVKPDSGSDIEEEWRFTSGEIKEIRAFMDAQEDPFSTETNQAFLEEYGKCRNYEEDIGYE